MLYPSRGQPSHAQPERRESCGEILRGALGALGLRRGPAHAGDPCASVDEAWNHEPRRVPGPAVKACAAARSHGWHDSSTMDGPPAWPLTVPLRASWTLAATTARALNRQLRDGEEAIPLGVTQHPPIRSLALTRLTCLPHMVTHGVIADSWRSTSAIH